MCLASLKTTEQSAARHLHATAHLRHVGPVLLDARRVCLIGDGAAVQRQQIVALGLRVAQRRPLPLLLGLLQ